MSEGSPSPEVTPVEFVSSPAPSTNFPGDFQSRSFNINLANGVSDRGFSFPANVNSRVMASVSELNGNFVPFMGQAGIVVSNVVPQNGGAMVKFNNTWPHPLNVRVSFLWQE